MPQIHHMLDLETLGTAPNAAIVQDNFYVYVLFDWMGTPRYVGKGQGNRINSHESTSDPNNRLKNEFIEQTWIMLGEIPKVKIFEYINESKAFELEIKLIALIGRMDQNKGPLVNLTDGGDGSSGIRFKKSRESVERGAAKQRGRKRPRQSLLMKEHNANLTAEEKSERARKANAVRSPDDRRSIMQRVGALQTSEQRSLFAIKRNLRIMRGRRWITNNIQEKFVPGGNEQLPEGWSLGRLKPPFVKAAHTALADAVAQAEDMQSACRSMEFRP